MLAVAGVVVWKFYQAGKVVDSIQEEIATTYNPASKENFIYQGTQSAGKSLGAWLYDVTH